MNIKNKEKDVSVWHAAPTSKVSTYYSVNDRSNKQYGGPSNRILYNIFFFLQISSHNALLKDKTILHWSLSNYLNNGGRFKHFPYKSP